MNIVKEDTFRSPGLGVNKTDNMVRATIDFTSLEFKNFKNNVVVGPCTYPLLCANAVKDEDTHCLDCPYGFNGPGKLLE